MTKEFKCLHCHEWSWREVARMDRQGFSVTYVRRRGRRLAASKTVPAEVLAPKNATQSSISDSHALR